MSYLSRDRVHGVWPKAPGTHMLISSPFWITKLVTNGLFPGPGLRELIPGHVGADGRRLRLTPCSRSIPVDVPFVMADTKYPGLSPSTALAGSWYQDRVYLSAWLMLLKIGRAHV